MNFFIAGIITGIIGYFNNFTSFQELMIFCLLIIAFSLDNIKRTLESIDSSVSEIELNHLDD